MQKPFLFFTLSFVIASAALLTSNYHAAPVSRFAADILSSTGLGSAPQPSDADTATTTLTDILQTFNTRQRIFARAIIDLRVAVERQKNTSLFTRTMKRGDVGADVTQLQKWLSVFEPSAPTSPSGFFGKETESAIGSFQTNHGVAKTKLFDAATRTEFMNAIEVRIRAEGVGGGSLPADLASLGVVQNLSSLASGDAQSMIADLQDRVDTLASSTASLQTTSDSLQAQINQIDAELNGPQTANATVTLTTPAPTPKPSPLTLSNIQVTNITRTSAVISWITSNPAMASVDYTQDGSNLMHVARTTNATAQTINLNGLSGGMTYAYWVTSTDTYGTTASSTRLTFKTSN